MMFGRNAQAELRQIGQHSNPRSDGGEGAAQVV